MFCSFLFFSVLSLFFPVRIPRRPAPNQQSDGSNRARSSLPCVTRTTEGEEVKLGRLC